MEIKKCFKCGRELPLHEFYKHPQMADGHLNKCKDCTKMDVHKNYLNNIESEEFVNKERARGREKYHRLYSSKPPKIVHSENKKTRAYLIKHGVNVTGLEVHHWNYNRTKDVILLTPRIHSRLHKLLKFEPQSKLFYYGDTLLDTKEKHISVILQNFGPECKIQSLDFEKCKLTRKTTTLNSTMYTGR